MVLLLSGLGSITFKSNVLPLHYIEFACIRLHYHYFIFWKVMHYVTLLFKCNIYLYSYKIKNI